MSGNANVLATKIKAAKDSEHPQPPAPVQSCPNKNWIELYYQYDSGRPVAGAKYKIFDANTNQCLASGSLNGQGFARVEGISDNVSDVTFFYTGDPKEFEIFNDKKPIPNPYKPLSTGDEVLITIVKWVNIYNTANNVVGEWVLGAIEGDFNDDQTLGQIIFDSVISLIPVVDQVADGRDIAANLYKLTWKKQYKDLGTWFALVTTVIGCFPEIGTAIKGCVKSVVKVGVDAGKKLIKKTGVRFPRLIRIMNSFGEGNVVKFLRWVVKHMDDFGKKVKVKIRELLNAFLHKCNEVKGKMFRKAQEIFEERVIKNIEAALENVEKMVDNIMGRAKKELDDVTKEAEDYSLKGATRTQNGARQLTEETEEAARKAWRKTAAAEAGMEEKELEGLVKHCKENDRRVIVRYTNPEGLKYHGKEGFVPKGPDVKLKGAKSGDSVGLVVRPKEPMADWERQNIEELYKKGYEFDGAGHLIDQNGNKIYSDYDLQAVHRKVMDENGKEVHLSELTNPQDGKVVDEINADVGREGRPLGQDKPVQHGAENDWFVKTDEKGDVIYKDGKPVLASEDDIMNNRAKLGRQHGEDEKYLIVNADGSVELAENPRELFELYKREGDEIPWKYDAVPPTGEELAKEQAARKAKNEAYERMAKAEAKAEQQQMGDFIDDIISSAGKFVEDVSDYAKLAPTPF